MTARDPERLFGVRVRVTLIRSFLIFCFAATAATAQESVYERRGVPGEMAESRFVLIAAQDRIELHTGPDLRTPERSIPYQAGWRIPFGETLVRTLEAVEASTAKAGSVDVWCDQSDARQMDLAKGETWTYLQSRGEGRGMVRMQGKICEVPVFNRPDVFGATLPQPLVHWWVQFLYADGTSPGWLLVSPERVTFGWRRCC